jgi:hypothetical protein
MSKTRYSQNAKKVKDKKNQRNTLSGADGKIDNDVEGDQGIIA